MTRTVPLPTVALKVLALAALVGGVAMKRKSKVLSVLLAGLIAMT